MASALGGNLGDGRQSFRVAGYERPGDGGAARWRLALQQAPGPGRRRHGLGLGWFELDTDRPTPEMLGAAADWNGETGRDNGPVLQELVAWANGRPIRLAAGRYLVSPILIEGPAALIGRGAGRTVLVQADTPGLGGRGALYVNSGRPDRRITGLRLGDFSIDGGVERRGFEEFTHLVSLHGVQDCLIERVAFLGFRGDGLYIGSGVHGGEERHNRDVVVRDCRFDGRNRDNRNAVSVLDVDGLSVRRCRFSNCSRPDMPGAIDFEPNPDSPFAVVRNVEISDNDFRDVGGGVGVICFHFAPAIPPPRLVRISGNSARNSGRAFLYANIMHASAQSEDAGFVVTGNLYASGSGGPFVLDGLRGVSLSGNRWTDLASAAQVGLQRRVLRMRLADRFERVGSLRTPYALGLASVSGVALRGTTFVDCGSPAFGGENIYFRGLPNGLPARSDHVDLSGAVSRSTSRRRRAMSAASPLHRVSG